jgi:hypothetical protein
MGSLRVGGFIGAVGRKARVNIESMDITELTTRGSWVDLHIRFTSFGLDG